MFCMLNERVNDEFEIFPTFLDRELDEMGLDNSHPPIFLDHSLNTIIYSLELSFNVESAPSPLEQMHAPAPGSPLWYLRGKWLLMHHVPNQD